MGAPHRLKESKWYSQVPAASDLCPQKGVNEDY